MVRQRFKLVVVDPITRAGPARVSRRRVHLGGEILCVAGRLRYERLVHLICHTILYAGIALVCVGAWLHWADRRRGRQ